MMKSGLAFWALAVSLSITACGAGTTNAASQPTPAAAPNQARAEGQLMPQSYVEVSFDVSGPVSAVSVAEGDRVSKGQVIARLDDRDQQQAVTNAQLAVKQAQIDVASAQHEVDVRVGWAPNQNQLNSAIATLSNAQAAVKAAQADYDKVAFNPSVSATGQSMALEQATNNYNKAKGDFDYLTSNSPDLTQARNNLESASVSLDAARVRLETAQTALDRVTLRAPIDGTITALGLKAGESVTAGQAVVTIADLSTWVVKTDDLTELEVVNISVGQAVRVTFDALPEKVLAGKVKDIALRSEEKRGDQTFTVTVLLTETDPALRWGMTASVEPQPGK